MSGEAFQMRVELARLMQKHQVAPAPFVAAALLPPVDHSEIVQGYCSPATIDRDRMKFAAHCWMPFRREIPLLFRHGRPAGEVLEVRADDKGLWVRALVTDSEARQCSFFSIAATVHSFVLRNVDDPKLFHGLITCCSLDEISIACAPANLDARILHRYRQPAMLENYDLLKAGFAKAAEIVAALQVINREHQRAQASAKPVHTVPRSPIRRASVPPAIRRVAIASTPRRSTEFGNLVEVLNER